MKEVELTIKIRKTYTSFMQFTRTVEALKKMFFEILSVEEPKEEDC